MFSNYISFILVFSSSYFLRLAIEKVHGCWLYLEVLLLMLLAVVVRVGSCRVGWFCMIIKCKKGIFLHENWTILRWDNSLEERLFYISKLFLSPSNGVVS